MFLGLGKCPGPILQARCDPPTKVLDVRTAHHLKALPQGIEVFGGQHLFGLGTPGHDPRNMSCSLFIRLRDKVENEEE